MNTAIRILSFAAIGFMAMWPLSAQSQENQPSADSTPVPENQPSADSTPVPETQPSAESSPVPETQPSAESSQALADAKPAEQPDAKPINDISARMLAFFDGLEKAVADAGDDCEAASAAMRRFYAQNEAWIASLDYATGSVDEETRGLLHPKAREFGKKLSACFATASISSQLSQYAGLGDE